MEKSMEKIKGKIKGKIKRSARSAEENFEGFCAMVRNSSGPPESCNRAPEDPSPIIPLHQMLKAIVFFRCALLINVFGPDAQSDCVFRLVFFSESYPAHTLSFSDGD